jgi:hypothetical protein
VWICSAVNTRSCVGRPLVGEARSM